MLFPLKRSVHLQLVHPILAAVGEDIISYILLCFVYSEVAFA